ncbi:MAG: IS110 family transposase [Dehalococcoidia bacterium]|nr:IS110 family transposase [Dehalococcoidia bacterium]
MSLPVPSSFAGVDWGNFTHEVCAIIQAKVHQRSFDHSPAGLHEMVRWLSSLAPADSVGVALEVPHGPVVEALQDGGFPVYSINPKQLDRFRDRHTVAGAKDDRRDAFVLATALQTDFERFKVVPQPDPEAVELRETSRLYESLTHDLHAHSNRLWQTLIGSAPQLLSLCKGADEPWFWELCERVFGTAPLPRRDWVLRLLGRHRKKLDPDAVLAILRAPGLALPASAAVAPLQVQALVPILRVIAAQREAARAHLAVLVSKAGDLAAIIDSQPGIDVILTGTLLGEARPLLEAADGDALRTLCGTAPVTRRSGKSHHVVMRRSCNLRLRSALRNWAKTAIRCEPRSREIYNDLRARGHRHERALRGLADRLLLRLVACLRDGRSYDPARWISREPASAA